MLELIMGNRRLAYIIIPLILIMCSCTKKNIDSSVSDSAKHSVESSTTTTIDYNYTSPINLEKYQGLYLPVNYIDILKDTYSHNKALSRLNTDASFLDVKKDHIESDSHYHDGFWIRREQIEKYDFSKANEGIIIDEIRNPYIKIGESSENRYDMIELYIHSLLFMKKEYYSDGKELIVNTDGSIELERIKYYLRLDIVFAPLDIDVYHTEEGHVIGIRAGSEKIEVIKLEESSEEFGYTDSREVIDTYYIEK
jgi:hypothetical protein